MFRELIEKNRSYRGYDESFIITREMLETLVDYARLSPSSGNIQPLKYYLSCDKETNSIIQPLTKWARNLPNIKLPRKGHCPTAFIVICCDTTIGRNAESFLKDVGIVAQSMLLGAVEMGFGGIMIGNFNPPAVKEALSLADNLEPKLIVAFGKPDEKVVLTVLPENKRTEYYRDENDTHYVPKRELKDIII